VVELLLVADVQELGRQLHLLALGEGRIPPIALGLSFSLPLPGSRDRSTRSEAALELSFSLPLPASRDRSTRSEAALGLSFSLPLPGQFALARKFVLIGPELRNQRFVLGLDAIEVVHGTSLRV